MITITEKELKTKKKPIQVYFDTEVLIALNEKLAKSAEKVSVSDYLRGLVEKDLMVEKPQKERKWLSVPLGLGDLASDSRAMDEIIYGV